jgi:hypothetical protein
MPALVRLLRDLGAPFFVVVFVFVLGFVALWLGYRDDP